MASRQSGFTDIDVPLEYFQETIKKQSIVNSGVRFILKNQVGGGFETYEYYYENGIVDYMKGICRRGCADVFAVLAGGA